MIAGGLVRRLLAKRDPALLLLAERSAEGEFLDYGESRPDADHTSFRDGFLQAVFLFDGPDDDDSDDYTTDPEPSLLTGARR